MRSLFAILALLVCFSPAISQTTSRPNVLVIIVDDLNDYQNYLLDGHPQAETPNLNRLARNGVVFQSAYCSAPRSCPSRTSLMSGKDPDYTGVYDNEGIQPVFRDNFQVLAKDTVVYTLPQVLRDSGYYTLGINKVYFGWKNEGFDNDFDTLEPDPCQRKLSWSEYIAFPPDQSLITYVDEGIPGFIWAPLADSVEPYMFDQLASDTAISLLNTYESNPSAFCNRPLFMTLGIFLPHKPLLLPRRYFRQDYLDPEAFYDLPYNKPYNDPPNQSPPNGVIMPPQPDPIWADFDALPPFGKDMASGGGQHETFIFWPDTLDVKPVVDTALTEEERNFILSESKRANAVIAYLAGVEFADAQIGRVLDALDSMNMAENTIVILLSDHGYSLGEKKHWHKFGLWETDTRIPLVIRHPEKSFCENVLSPVSTLDIFPTVLEMTGIGAPKFPDGRPYLDGESLMPFLANPSLMRNRPAVTSLRQSGTPTRCFVQFSVRDEQFHYIKHRGLGEPGEDFCDTAKAVAQEELYLIGRQRDLDKNEWKNLSLDPRYKSVKNYLSQWIADSSLYLQTMPRIDIVHGELPCSFAFEDTLALCYELTDADGEPMYALPDSTTIRWYTSFRPDEPFYGNVFRFRIKELMNASNFTVDKLLPVFVELVDMASGTVLALDYQHITVNPELNPDLLFTLTRNGNTVAVDTPEYFHTEKILRYHWSFGDSTTSSEAIPAPHRYSLPGTYTVTGKLFFGNDEENLCSVFYSQTITLDDSLFENGPCLAPENLRVSELMTNGATLAWNPVYGAEDYELRLRKLTGADTSWQGLTSSTAFALLNSLSENQEYEWQVRTFCDTNLTTGLHSEWSYPDRFTTSVCFSPRGISVIDVSDHTASLTWLPDVYANQGYRVVYRKAGQPANSRDAENPFITLTGLDSASLYQFRVISQCEERSAPDLFRGTALRTYTFLTDSSARRNVPADFAPLQVIPNPASTQFRVEWPAAHSGDVNLQIVNALGYLVAGQQVRQVEGSNSAVFSATTLPPGIYLMSLSGAEPKKSVVFEVLR